MIFNRKYFAIMALGMLLLAAAAQADRRSYVWTYEYQTIGKGEAEFEYYLTGKVADLHNFDDKNTWEHQLELEYGVTDHLQMSIYQRFQQTSTTSKDSDFDYTGSKIQGRYRIGEKDDLPLDTALYIEYIRGEGSNDEDLIEYKLILSKDIGPFNVTYNQVIENVVAEGKDTAYEYTAGVFYEFNPTWHVGLESTGSYTTDAYRMGPTVSWATQKGWITAGFLRGLNDRTNDFQARLIVGVPF